jgi:N-methylhydantoinase A
MIFERALDVRYVGQEYTVSVGVGSDVIDEAVMIGVIHRFHGLHERQYGHSSPGEPLELVDLRVVAQGLIPKLVRKQLKEGAPGIHPGALLGESDTFFSKKDGTLRTALINRTALEAGNTFDGPAIVVERTATTVIEPGFHARVLSTGEIMLHREF